MLGDRAVATHLETTGSFEEYENRCYVTVSAHGLFKYMTVNKATVTKYQIDKRFFLSDVNESLGIKQITKNTRNRYIERYNYW